MNFYTNVAAIGNNIYCVGYKDGRRFNERVPFSPTLYTPTNNDYGFTNIDGQNLQPRKFDSIREARDWVNMHSEIDNFRYYGNTNYAAQYVLEEFGETIDYDPSHVRISTIDIEVASDNGFPEAHLAEYPVITITMHQSGDGLYHVWGLQEYDQWKCEIENLDPKLIRYYHCKSEVELLTDFVSFWNNDDNTPDVVTGWYIRLFDIPYLVNRIGKIIGPNSVNRLSPWNRVNERELLIMNNKHQAFDLGGVQQLDYLDLFRKFGYTFGQQESYKLDHIAHVVLGEKKLSYEEHGNLHTLYKNDFQKFVDYNIKDVQLVVRMNDVLDFIGLCMTIAYRSGGNYIDSLGTVGVWDNIIYRDLASRHVAINPKQHHHKADYPGAFVKPPRVGKSRWVASFDLASLYPNLIIQYNMSPETITGEIDFGLTVDMLLEGKYKNTSNDAVAATGVHFSLEKRGVVPSLVKALYEERKVVKAKMLAAKQAAETDKSQEAKNLIAKLDNQQMSIKILMNSLYGALANQYFRYFDPRIAAAITTSGQLSIRWAEKAINEYFNAVLKTDDDYVIAIDTDSLYIDMSKLVELVYGDKAYDPEMTDEIIKFMDKACAQKIYPKLQTAYEEMFQMMGGFENRMDMDREALADAGIWTGKKRYILNVYNNEGVQYAEPKLKIMGIEAVKSSTPAVCRDKLKESFKIAISGTEDQMQKFIADFRADFTKLQPHEVAFPRSVSNVEDKADRLTIYKKGTPIHVRGSLLHNHHLKQKGLDKTYELIKSGEKIKFCYLKMPNLIREDVIAFPQYLPEELGLHDSVDYNKQFDKSFVEPLKSILDAIGWTPEKVYTLDAFFG